MYSEEPHKTTTDISNTMKTSNFSIKNWLIKSGIRWAGHVAQIGRMRSACVVSVREPEGKRQTMWETKA